MSPFTNTVTAKRSFNAHLKAIARLVYDNLPFKQLFFEWVRLFWRPPEWLYQHFSFHGVVKVRLDTYGVCIDLEHRGSISENQLFWAGIDGWYEKTSLQVWLRLARRSKLIIDVGSNSGVYALTAMAVSPESAVIAFEPMPETFLWLESNNRRNGAKISVESYALSNAQGKFELWQSDVKSHYTPSLYEARVREGNDGIRVLVETTCLDVYFAEMGLGDLDLIKIDVERHEPEVLQGMRSILRSSRPAILIEVLDDATGINIQKEIEGLGYIYFNIHESNETLRKVDVLGRSDSYNYLLIQADEERFLKEQLANTTIRVIS